MLQTIPKGSSVKPYILFRSDSLSLLEYEEIGFGKQTIPKLRARGLENGKPLHVKLKISMSGKLLAVISGNC